MSLKTYLEQSSPEKRAIMLLIKEAGENVDLINDLINKGKYTEVSNTIKVLADKIADLQFSVNKVKF